MGLLVVEPGLFTTVQDLGRPGYRDRGVPTGGAFDVGSAGLANALVGNDPGCAVLEMTLDGGVYQALAPLALAIAGAAMPARIVKPGGPERRLSPPMSFTLEEGELIAFGPCDRNSGVRSYLAVRGGWDNPLVLGSRSSETPLKAGERLPCAPGRIAERHPKHPPVLGGPELTIRVVAGPDGDLLDPRFLTVEYGYTVQPRSDRAGLRLLGPGWPVAADANRVSAPVAPGAVQAAGGQPLLLGVACGTMGGYPHVAHVISADLDRVAQARPGGLLRFETVSLDFARQLDLVGRKERKTLHNRVAIAARDLVGIDRERGGP